MSISLLNFKIRLCLSEFKSDLYVAALKKHEKLP
jgi:hypothetical protein